MKIKKLIKHIEKIDPEAAKFIKKMNKSQKLLNKTDKSQKLLNKVNFNSTGAVCLGSLMMWSETPQGHDYWAEIDNKLNLQ